MKIERYIPNTVTFANLCCGFLGAMNVIHGDLETAAFLVFAAAFFDLFDGLIARWLGLQSRIGEQLDSFADLISFGVLPGMILLFLLIETNANWIRFEYFLNIPVLGLLGLLFPVGAAYRLAKFNLRPDQSMKAFLGVPCPAAGLFVASLPLIIEYDLLLLGYKTFYLAEWVLNPWLLMGIMVIVPLLMVSNIPMFSLKLSGLQWSGYQVQIIFSLISIILFVFLYFVAIPIIFILYIMVSMVFQKQLT